MGLQPLYATTRLSRNAGIDQRHTPVRWTTGAVTNLPPAHVNNQVATQRTVINHVLLNDFTFISECDGEIGKAVVRVILHNVPQNRLSTDFYHRLGFQHRFLGKAGSDATCKDCYFHDDQPPSTLTARTVSVFCWSGREHSHF